MHCSICKTALKEQTTCNRCDKHVCLKHANIEAIVCDQGHYGFTNYTCHNCEEPSFMKVHHGFGGNEEIAQ